MSVLTYGFMSQAGIGCMAFSEPQLRASALREQNVRAAAAHLAFAQDDETTSGLTWAFRKTKVYPNYRTGQLITIEAGTLELEPNATNYVQCLIYPIEAPSVIVNQAGFFTGDTTFPLWEIETDGAGIIGKVDRRTWLWANARPDTFYGAYEFAALPDPFGLEGVTVWVTAGATGAPCAAISDGTDWLPVTTGEALTAS